MDFTYEQAKILLCGFGGDEEALITVDYRKENKEAPEGFQDAGLYAHSTDYPEEGYLFLGKNE